MNANQKAFLDMVAISELGAGLIAASDNGYNVLVGSTANHPLLFNSYKDHPRIYNRQFDSTAAGRYQLLARYFDHYKKFLFLSDFGPESQDAIALQQIRECRAMSNVITGNIRIAIAECSNIWASLPGNSYGQHQNNMQDLCDYFCTSGGRIA